MKENLSIKYIKYYSISKYVTAMQLAECSLMLRTENGKFVLSVLLYPPGFHGSTFNLESK